ncbi:MAG: hypothetical protein QOJ50_3800 [Cryptosporangiaceae bacterium]|nr:hypothetical protein [Cryptosporangiaceae bacterium]
MPPAAVLTGPSAAPARPVPRRRGLARLLPVVRRVRSVAGMTVVVAVTGGGFALAAVSTSGTGAIAIPSLHNASVAKATQALANLISPVPEQHVGAARVSPEQLEDAFAVHTFHGGHCRTSTTVGSITLTPVQLAQLTDRATADPAFAAHVSARQQAMCSAELVRARPVSAVRAG